MTDTGFADRYGPWALVLGASEGLGEGISAEAAKRGLNVAMVARRQDVLQVSARCIARNHNVETRPIAADMGDPDIVGIIERGLDGAEIGLVVYNGAAEPWGTFLDQGISEHEYNIAVNVEGATRIAHHFGRKLAKRRRGGIVINSSLAAEQGIYSYAVYGAAKAYEMILAEGLWVELGEHGVDVCALMVGSTYSPNFQRIQRRKKTIFADTRLPAGLPEGTPIPQAPEDAAAHLFAQLEAGDWQPRIFANPTDAARNVAKVKIPKADQIRLMGQAMRTGYRSGMKV